LRGFPISLSRSTRYFSATVTNKKAQLSIIYLTVFIDLIGFGIVIPVLPLYAQHFGANEWVNGILVGIYSCMQFIFAPVLGRISDRVGRRPVLLISILGTSLGFFIMGFARTLAWLFVARIIDGLSGSNIATAQAYIADITTPEERTRAMGMIGAAFGLGFTFGPGIGGVLSKYSIGAPFLFAAALALINAALAFVRLPESLPPEHRVNPEDRAPISEVFKHGWHLPALMACYFFAIAGFSMMTSDYALFTHARFGYGQFENGCVFFFIGILGVLIQGGLLRRMVKTRSEKSLAIMGVVILMLGMAWLPLVTGLATLLCATGLVGIGNSFITPTLNGLASRSAERTWQGRVVGLMQSSGALARWLGPMLAGFLLSKDAGHAWYGRTPFWSAVVVLILALAVAIRLPAKPITATS
jgi:MFS transporter, DHA1 family, tetracycline resistance protein